MLKGKILSARVIAISGILISSLYMFAVYSDVSFDAQELFGATTGEKRFEIKVL